MKELNTGSIDLIVTSPPYWNLIDYDHPKQLGKNISYKQFLYYLKRNLFECMRVLKEDGLACFIVGDIRSGKYNKKNRPSIYPLHADLIHFFTEEMDFDLFQHFVWEKYGVKKGEKSKIVYGSRCRGEDKDYAVPVYLYNDLLTEHILIFRKPGIRKLPTLKERFSETCNRLKISELQQWLKPVWKINSTSNKNHKATLPYEIAERIIRMYSLKDDTVLDPFCGTGTTLEAAVHWKRNAIGFEINENYILDFVKTHNLLKERNMFFTLSLEKQND